MNEEEVIVAAGSYFGLKDLVPRLFGPTADYLGENLKNLTEKGVENVKRVFLSAEKKLGNKMQNPGVVSPRVLKNILSESYFCNDSVAVEYFGGVLASSRANDDRDDRGAYFAALLGRMSSYQIRSHYVIYHCFKHVYNGKRIPFNHMEWREKASVFIPLRNYLHAMGCKRNEPMDAYLEHACVGLLNESLISDYFAHGASAFYRLQPPTGLENSSVMGLVVAPTRLGLDLFLWSHGEGAQPVHQVFFQENNFEVVSEVELSFEKVIKTPVAREWDGEEYPAKI